MSEKHLEMSVLLDFYGALLNEKQRTAAELYYYEDLSLSEIAENMSITRQGVHDHIKNAQIFLLSCEDALSLCQKEKALRTSLCDIQKLVSELSKKYGEDEKFGQINHLIEGIVNKGI